MYQIGSAILKPFGVKIDPRRVMNARETRERLRKEKQKEAEIQRQLREFDIQIERLALNYSKLLYPPDNKALNAKGVSRSNVVQHVKLMPEFEDWILRCYQGKGSYEEMYWYHKQLKCTCPSISRRYICEPCPYSRMR